MMVIFSVSGCNNNVPEAETAKQIIPVEIGTNTRRLKHIGGLIVCDRGVRQLPVVPDDQVGSDVYPGGKRIAGAHCLLCHAEIWIDDDYVSRTEIVAVVVFKIIILAADREILDPVTGVNVEL